MSDPIQEVLDRARVLAESGPGEVNVAKTTGVAFVGIVRELTAGLDEERQQRVQDIVGELEEVLLGIEGDDVSLENVRPWHRRSGLLLYIDLIRAPKKTMAEMQAVRSQKQHNEMIYAAGGPKPRGGPLGLVKAAEAWLVANLADPDVITEEQRITLTDPWTTARVTANL